MAINYGTGDGVTYDPFNPPVPANVTQVATAQASTAAANTSSALPNTGSTPFLRGQRLAQPLASSTTQSLIPGTTVPGTFFKKQEWVD